MLPHGSAPSPSFTGRSRWLLCCHGVVDAWTDPALESDLKSLITALLTISARLKSSQVETIDPANLEDLLETACF